MSEAEKQEPEKSESGAPPQGQPPAEKPGGEAPAPPAESLPVEESVEMAAAEPETRAFSPEEIEQLLKKAEERDQFYDKFLRAKAELINYQKRVQRDKETASEIAVMDLMRIVLPVLDNFDRALQSAHDHKHLKGFRSGIELIESQMYKALEAGGVKEMNALGQPFNPNFHESVLMEQNNKYPDGTVIEVLQKGYTYKDKVLRPAKVKISKKG